MKSLKTNKYWVELFENTYAKYDDLLILDEFLKEGESSEEEVKEQHNLLLLIILIIFLQSLQEYRLLLHVNLKMSNLIFSIENTLNETFPLNIVNSHGGFDNVSCIDDQLLGVGQDTK